MPLPRGIDVIVGMDYMIENDVILLSRSQTVMFGGTLCCYGKPESHQNELEAADVSHDSLGRMAVDTITESVVPVPAMCDVPAVSETSPRSRDLNVDIVNGVNSGSPGTQSSSGAAPSPASVALAPGHDQHLAVNAVSTASQPVKTAKARRSKDPQSVEYQRYKIQNERLKWPQDDPGINASDALQRNLSLSWNEERMANPGRYRHWCPPGHIRQKLYSMALDRDTVPAQTRVASMKEQQKDHCDSQPSLLSQLNDMVEVDVVDSAVFDKLMSMKPSESGSTCEMWLAYCDLAKRPESERQWAERSPATSAHQEPACMVMLSQKRESSLSPALHCVAPVEQPSHSLAAAGRKPKLKRSMDEFARAYSTPSNPVDPTPENLEKWLEAAYPKDANGVSIRHQINKTIPEQQQWVVDLLAGKICPLAAAAFACGLAFDPPCWAEKLRMTLLNDAPAARNGGRIKCPVHLREALAKFHSDLYARGFILPAEDCESYATVLIVRKPDDENGKPRGWRFVVDLRNRNETVRPIANQLPEAVLLFEYLRNAKAISLFDVKDGYWNCPLHEESQNLTAFQSEAGQWKWCCLPQGLAVSGPYFQAWIMRIFRKYNIVINQTRFIDLKAEAETQARTANMVSTAAKLSSMLAVCPPTDSTEQRRTVESTLDVADGRLQISRQQELAHLDPRSALDRGSGNVISATPAALEWMSKMAPISGSDPEALEAWAAEAQGPAAVKSAMQSLSAMCGGIPVDQIWEKSRDERRPADLGVWKGEGFASLYLDDAMLRALRSSDEHRLQILTFLRICAIERIPLGAAKAEIFCQYVRYLGMINGNGILVPCPTKVVSIVQLERPWDVNTLQQFLGAVNWFRRHIAGHAKIQEPLNSLTKKGVKWEWGDQQEQAWLSLKRSLMTFPVLRTFDPALDTLLYTDSSKVHVGGCVCQRVVDEDGSTSIVAIAYFSRSLRGPELSYPIQQQEMLAVVGACQVFEHYLLAAKITVRCCVDHKSLTSSFKGLSKVACDRITRWVQKISIFDMTMQYLPGVLMEMPDLLSRCLKAPDDAWKSMDVIDQRDFEYAPLAFLEPQYLTYLQLYAHALEEETTAPPSEYNFDASTYWLPHEKCMMMSVAPQSSSIIGASDYLCCPEFHAVYAALRVEGGKSNDDVEADKKLAMTLLASRYAKLELPVPELPKLSQAKLRALVLRCSIVGGLLYYQHRKNGVLLCVPNVYNDDGINHRQLVFNELHATPYGGHRGSASTWKAIRVRFFWKTMGKDVNAMYNACHECNVSKISRTKPQGLLQPVQTPLQIAQSYNLDRLGPFPESRNGNHMMMIAVDRFSRWIWLEPLKITCNSEQFADLFVNRVLLRGGRGIPESLISDNDTLITANFWRTLFKRFGTTIHLSSARTQSTNGLAERYVAVVEEILRTRVNYDQTDWEEMIPHLEFAVNNQGKHTITGLAPTKVELGITPVLPADLISRVTRAKAKANNQLPADEPKSAAADRIAQMECMREEIMEHLDVVQQEQKIQADKRRSTIDKLLQVGAKAYVFMPAERLQQHGLRPSRKLGNRCYGPFTILERVSTNAFKLDLGVSAASTRIIDVFHVKYLKSASDGPYPTPVKLLPAPVNEGNDEEPEWELERILDRRSRRSKFQFLVQYKGYPLLDDCQWRSQAELEELAPQMLNEFQQAYEKNRGSKRKRK